MPIVAKMFYIFSLRTFEACKSFNEVAVKAKADATTKTMMVAKIKVYRLLSLFMIKRI